MTDNSSAPAFPVNELVITNEDRSSSVFNSIGFTKRQYYSGLALQGILANQLFDGYDNAWKAKEAVSAADALIAELSKPQQP